MSGTLTRPAAVLPGDTCDGASCPARTKHRYQDPETGSELGFCGHHSNKHGPYLDERGWRITAVTQ